MSILQHKVRITPEEYLEGEQYSQVRHEYVAGEVHAMVGASRAHSLIAGNLHALLHQHLRDTPCQVHMADLKVKAGEAFYYPDLLVECERQPELEAQFSERPILVVEVLSPSTERRDRTEKRFAYQTLPSLREYVLIAQQGRQVSVYRRRTDADGWDLESMSGTDRLWLASVELSVMLDELYRGVG